MPRRIGKLTLGAVGATAAFTLFAVEFVDGHGAVSHPKPRNAIDGTIAPWNGTVPEPMPFMFWCTVPSAEAAGTDPRNVTGSNGQACFWFK